MKRAHDDKAFERGSRRIDTLSTQIVERLGEIITSMPWQVAPQTLVEFLADDLVEKDEQLFRWLLESQAAKKIWDQEAAKANLHPQHSTFN